MSHQPTPTARRRSVAAGLTAGLIGGAAAGIAFGVPAVTGAADDDPDPAAAVLRQTDTDDETGPGADTDTDAGADTGDADIGDTGSDTASARAAHAEERLRELLQPLVDGGTIDADQADAVVEQLVEQLVENRPDRPGRGGPGRFGGPGGFDHHGPVRVATEAVTDLLGLEPDELFEQLRDGATLAEVAEANGVDRDELVDTLVAAARDRLDEAVGDGRVDADTAAERAAELEERIAETVDRGRPGRDAPTDREDPEDPDDTRDG